MDGYEVMVGMLGMAPCGFENILQREFNWREEKFEWKRLKGRPKRVSRVRVKDCAVINGVQIPSSFVIRVLVGDEEKNVTVGDVLKLVREGKDVKTSEGSPVSVEAVEECDVCVFEFDTEYPPHDVFVVAKGLKVRVQDPEALAGTVVSGGFASLVTELLPGILELEFDKSILRHAQVTKKRYAGWKNEDKLLVKGLEIVRRDWGEKAKELQRKAIMLVLHKPFSVAKAEVERMVREEVERFERGDFSINEVILSSGVRDLSQYKATKDGRLPNLPQIRVALQLADAGIIVPPGSKVEYIAFKVRADDVIAYLNGKLSIHQLLARVPRKKSETPPLYERVVARELVEDRFEELKQLVDTDYYLENQILPPVLRFAYSIWPNFKTPAKKRDKKTKSLMNFLRPARKVGSGVV